MPQVIIVSNRLPVSVKKVNGQLSFSASLGGLATGLSSFFANNQDNLWIGWPGIASDDLTEEDKQLITKKLSAQGYRPIFLSRRQINSFYNGYSNSVLWPLFHGLPVRATPAQVDRWWKAYQSVNQIFADAIINTSGPDSQVWVHDYQLLLVPEQLRSKNPEINIGFFLHIPFPASRQLKKIDHGSNLIAGMLGADLIGFHTNPYVEDFLSSASKLSSDITDNQIDYNGRIIRAAAFPMGIDYNRFAEANKLEAVRRAVKKYKRKYTNLKLIVSIDRLDPSKGLVERLKAYQRFLEKYPKQRGRVILIMVAAPSRTDIEAYKNLAEELQSLSQKINKTYGTANWQPVDYINAAVPFEEVTALFQIADVAFIAPLKDGMNLAAKEFVASNKQRGVLILSETAGAAEELRGALIVNPRDLNALAEALNDAIAMQRSELKFRLSKMRKYLAKNTVQHWAVSFIDALQQPLPVPTYIARSLNKKAADDLIKKYTSAKKRLLLLDYDGSLVPFDENYLKSSPPESLLSLLNNLAKNPSNDIVVISGRAPKQLEAWFGDLPINLVAEHGASIKVAGSKGWRVNKELEGSWKDIVLPTLQAYAQKAPGIRVEVKPNSLVWHYRAATPYYAQKYTVIVKRILRPFTKKYGLEILQGNKVMEIKDPVVSKGNAAKEWVNKGYDFVLAIGDDVTDEELFTSLSLSAYTLKVGRGPTKARYRLVSHRTVLNLLNKLV